MKYDSVDEVRNTKIGFPTSARPADASRTGTFRLSDYFKKLLTNTYNNDN